MPDLKSLVRQALINRNMFADAATTTVDGQSQSYRKIADAYHNVARLIIAEMNVEAEDRQIGRTPAATKDSR